MPEYKVSFELRDSQNRKARKVFETQTLADFAAAQTAAAGLAADLAAVSMGDVLAYTISERTVYTDAATAGSNVDEGAHVVARKADNYNVSVAIPMPESAVRNSDGPIDVENALITDYMANFTASGDFTVSDGETIVEIIGGTLYQ